MKGLTKVKPWTVHGLTKDYRKKVRGGACMVIKFYFANDSTILWKSKCYHEEMVFYHQLMKGTKKSIRRTSYYFT